MGCLFEILFDVFFGALFELITNGWLSLIQWIIPKKGIGRTARVVLKIVIGIFSGALVITFLIGILCAIFTEATVMDLWMLIFIPLGIMLAQTVLGIIVRMVTRKK